MDRSILGAVIVQVHLCVVHMEVWMACIGTHTTLC